MEKEVPIELWHKRLGHLSEKGLQRLARKDLLPGIKCEHLQNYIDCIHGKQHRVRFWSFIPSRKTNVLDLVHINVCTMQTRSLGGALYFVTFIDDCSKKL